MPRVDDSFKTWGSIAVSLSAIYVIKRLFWSRQENEIPRGKWRHVGVVTGLNTYPIKSCKATALDKATVTPIGLEEIPQNGELILGDRRLAIVDSCGKAVSCVTHTQLLRLKAESLTNMKIILTFDTFSTTVVIPFYKSPDCYAKIYSGTVSMIDCGNHVASWLQKVVFDGKPGYRLCAYPNHGAKRENKSYVDNFARYYPLVTYDVTGASTEFPFLLLNESSIEDLKKRITVTDPSSITCKNFRANIVIQAAPYEEDVWQWIKIGTTVFRIIKPCVRCAMTNVDPETTKRIQNLEPLTTMKTYRMLDDERRAVDPYPVMGAYLRLWTPNRGMIKLGDAVSVLE